MQKHERKRRWLLAQLRSNQILKVIQITAWLRKILMVRIFLFCIIEPVKKLYTSWGRNALSECSIITIIIIIIVAVHMVVLIAYVRIFPGGHKTGTRSFESHSNSLIFPENATTFSGNNNF